MRTIIFSIISAGFLLWSLKGQAEVTPSQEHTLEHTIKEAIRNLVEDNRELAKATPASHFKEFADIQNPRTTMVLCSDSRVQVDNLTQGAENDIFVVRNIGNQLVTTKGSVEFGVRVLKTPVLIFVGHSHCGAIKAAVGGDFEGLPSATQKELKTLDVKGMSDKEGVVVNVHQQVDTALSDFKEKVEKGELAIIGAIYDFRNDYGYGEGHLIIVNLNGKKDPQDIQNSHYFNDLKDVSIGIKNQEQEKKAS